MMTGDSLPSSYEFLEGIDHDKDFSRLQGKVYADYAGAPPYPESVVTLSTQDLLVNVYSNPHSEQGLGEGASLAAVDTLRQKTLQFCNASPAEYECILTSGATAALKLVAESFPWQSGSSTFLYLQDNHTSVLGMRNIAAQNHVAGIASVNLIHSDESKSINEDIVLHILGEQQGTTTVGTADMKNNNNDEGGNRVQHLFAFPLESNFDGTRYNPALVSAIQQRNVLLLNNQCDDGRQLAKGQWRVLLDAAKAGAGHPPDLSVHKADFVVLSYYKMFGYPTGLGALLVRKDALKHLYKPYFGGGTVLACLSNELVEHRRQGGAAFEDGTLPFLSIPAALRGFEFIQRLGGPKVIDKHAYRVAHDLRQRLLKLRHGNGSCVCQVYNGGSIKSFNASTSATSSVVIFSVLDDHGNPVGYRQVERLAALRGIMLRTGCLCNPGACALALNLSNDEIKENFEAGHVCWGDSDVVNGKATGVVRASFGYASKLSDAAAIATFIAEYFTMPVHVEESDSGAELKNFFHHGMHGMAVSPLQWHVEKMFVYPIKSCPGFEVQSWPLGHEGLFLDRHWVLLDTSDRVLTLKRCPALSSIFPTIDLTKRVLIVRSNNMEQQLYIPLNASSEVSTTNGNAMNIVQVGLCRNAGVCMDTVNALYTTTAAGDCSLPFKTADEWFSEALNMPCRFLEFSKARSDVLSDSFRATSSANFANSAQFLVISTSSLKDLYHRSGVEEPMDVFIRRFRPNIVVHYEQEHGGEGVYPYIEESWSKVVIGGAELIAVAPCMRCDVVCKSPKSGQKDKNVLSTLAASKKQSSRTRLCFGLLLNQTVYADEENEQQSPVILSVGNSVTPSV